uniref:Uncharacterized protein n=1 Tax=Aegilops tauschii TaxID=37682 RepID=M8C7F3_AEGTA
MSHTCMLYFEAHQHHAKFQDNHASVMKKEEAAVGAKHVQAHKKQVKFQDNHANDINIDDVSKDVDTVALDFINRYYNDAVQLVKGYTFCGIMVFH